jgi:hypothetical protein
MDFAVPDYANSYSDSYLSHDVWISDYDYENYDYSKCGGNILVDVGRKKLDDRRGAELCSGWKNTPVDPKPLKDIPGVLPDPPTFSDISKNPLPLYKTVKQKFYDGLNNYGNLYIPYGRAALEGFSSRKKKDDHFVMVLLFIFIVYLTITCITKSIENNYLKQMIMMKCGDLKVA